MVIKTISSDISLKLNHWKDLEKLTHLIENEDNSMPEYEILNNGKQWIIKNIKKKKWVKNIPERAELKRTANIKMLFLIRGMNLIKKYYRAYLKRSVLRIKNRSIVLKRIKQILDKIELNLRKYIKAPQMHRFE